MKKKISILILLCFLCFFAFADENPYLDPYYGIQGLENYTKLSAEDSNIVYNGDNNFKYALKNFNFKDVDLKNRVYAQKLALLGISKGTGNNHFSPNKILTNIDALKFLLRAIGKYDDIYENVKEENKGVLEENLTKAINDRVVETARNSGIISNESFDYYANITRNKFKECVKNTFEDDNLDVIFDNTIKNNEITRIDFAKFYTEYIKFHDKNSTKSGYVFGIRETTEDGKNYKIYDLINSNGNIERIKLDENSGFVVLSDSLSSNNIIKINDEIEYLIDDNKVKFAYKLSGDFVKNEIIKSYSNLSPIDAYQGIIKGVIFEKDKDKNITRITIELDNDRMVEITKEFNIKENVEDSFFVLKNSKIIKPDDLKKDDNIAIYLKDNVLLYARVGEDVAEYVQGNIKSIELDEDRKNGKISIFNYNDTISTFELDPDTQIYLNGYKITIDEVKPGATCDVVSEFNKVINLYVHSYTPEIGYIDKRDRIEFDKVLNIEDNIVYLEKGGKLTIDNYVKFIKNSKEIPYNSLRKGDYIKIYYDDIYSELPTRIEIEGQNQKISRIIKANVINYNQFNNTITLSNIYDFNSRFWKKQQLPYQESFKIALDASIFENNELFDKRLFNKESVNREVYAVVKDNFGSKEISKMIFKTGNERNHSEAIRNYNQVLNNITLKNKRILNYNDATIFVEDGRMVSDRALRKDANIVAISNAGPYEDETKIAFILEDHKPVFENFYIAALEDVDPYWITVSNHTHIDGYKFTPIDRTTQRFSLTDETTIYDVSKEKYLTPEELFNGRYPKSENEDKNNRLKVKYKRYYIIAYIKDGEVQSMLLSHKGIFEGDNIDDKARKEFEIAKYLAKSLENVNYTQGVIETKIDKWKRISLKDSYNYFNSLNEWNMNTANTTVEITSTTLILKHGKLLKYQELQENDKCYVIRIGYKAIYVIVE